MIRIRLTENDEIEMTDEEFNDFFNEYDLEADDLILPFEEVKDCIKGITLLSADEAENLLTEEQRKCKYNNEPCWWWLRSPGGGGGWVRDEFLSDGYSPEEIDQMFAAYVNLVGSVRYVGYNVCNDIGCVRPALILSNLKSSNLKSIEELGVGEHFEFGGYTFTVISNKYALCDEAIDEMAFREDYEAKDANVYEKSDVKKFLDNWFRENYK